MSDIRLSSPGDPWWRDLDRAVARSDIVALGRLESVAQQHLDRLARHEPADDDERDAVVKRAGLWRRRAAIVRSLRRYPHAPGVQTVIRAVAQAEVDAGDLT